MSEITRLLQRDDFTHGEIVTLLSAAGDDLQALYDHALEVKAAHVGRKVWLRGLIEYSNRCAKNCLYCGIRCANKKVRRYTMTHDEVIAAALYAHRNRFGSIVIQAGERSGAAYTGRIEQLLHEINGLTGGELHITLSLGEQKAETYRRWFAAGAHRYLLRIETSDPGLYTRIHPDDGNYFISKRLRALDHIREAGFMVGTGVMIGLPGQTLNHLASDLLFFRDRDVDMVGMGPYIEHRDTPLYVKRDSKVLLNQRLELSLKMVAILRIMMKDINIAATTAMQTIDPHGRARALSAGANVVMPNVTPLKYKEDYLLYNDKPGTEDDAARAWKLMEEDIMVAGDTIGYGDWGDPEHFNRKARREAGKE